MIEVKAEDRNDNQLKYGESSADTSSNGSLVIDSEHLKEFKAMKLQLERQRRVVLKFRQKMEKDLKLLQDQMKMRRPSRPSDGGTLSGSDFYIELGAKIK